MPDIRLDDGTIVRNVPAGVTKDQVQAKLDAKRARDSGTEGSDYLKALGAGINRIGASIAGMVDDSFIGDAARAIQGMPTKKDAALENPLGGKLWNKKMRDEYLARLPEEKRAEVEAAAAAYMGEGPITKDIQQFFADNAEYWNKNQSKGAQAKRGYVAGATGLVDAVRRYKNEPQAALMAATENAPQIGLMLATKGAPAQTQAVLGAIGEAAMTAEEARQSVLADAKKSGASAQDSIAASEKAADLAFASSIPTALLGGVGDVAALRRLTGGAGGPEIKGGLMQIPKQAGKEAAEEFAQESMAQVAQNKAIADTYDPSRSLLEGAGVAGVHGAMAGGVMGAGTGAMLVPGADGDAGQSGNPATPAPQSDSQRSALDELRAAADEQPVAPAPEPAPATGLSGVVQRAQSAVAPDLSSVVNEAIATGQTPDFGALAQSASRSRAEVVDMFNRRRSLVEMAETGDLAGMREMAGRMTADPVEQDSLIEQAVAVRDKRRAMASQPQAAQQPVAAAQDPEQAKYAKTYEKALGEAVAALESGKSDVDAFLPLNRQYKGKLNDSDLSGLIDSAKQAVGQKRAAAKVKEDAIAAAVPHVAAGDEISAVTALADAGITDDAEVQAALKEASSRTKQQAKQAQQPAAKPPEQSPMDRAVAAIQQAEQDGKGVKLAAIARRFGVGMADLAVSVARARRAPLNTTPPEKEPAPQVLALPAPKDAPVPADQPLVSRRGRIMPRAQAEAMADVEAREKRAMRRDMAEEAGNPTGVPTGMRPRVEAPARAKQKAVLPDIILRTDGKPFPNEEQATRAMKNKGATETHEIAPAPEGNGVVLKAKRNGPSTFIDAEKDDILAAIAKAGGVDWEQARAQGGFDPAESGRRGFGIMRVFKKNGGMPLDRMAEKLSQYGYPVTDGGDYSVNALLDAIDAALRGGQVGAPQFNERLAREMFDQEAEWQALDDAFDGNSQGSIPDWLDDGADGMIAAADESDAVIEAVASVLDEVENEQGTGPVAGAGQETDTGAAPRGGEGSRAQAAEAGSRGQREGQADTEQGAEGGGFSLTAQTEAERLAEEQRQAAAIEAQRREDERARQKAEADRDLSSFTLTGSDRPADVAMAAGQNDLFAPRTRGQKEAEKKAVAVSSPGVIKTIVRARNGGRVIAVVSDEHNGTMEDMIRVAKAQRRQAMADHQDAGEGASVTFAEEGGSPKWRISTASNTISELGKDEASIISAEISNRDTGDKIESTVNSVMTEVRSMGGDIIGVITDQYSGNKDDILKIAQSQRDRMFGRYPDASNMQSTTIATDAEGNPAWRVRPNMSGIEQIGRQVKAVAPDAPAIESKPEPVKWFGSRDKAEAWIAKEQRGDWSKQYHVVQAGPSRFEVFSGKKPATPNQINKQGKPARKRIGVNYRGETLYEDDNGVRSYATDGVLVSEAVTVVPGRGYERGELTKEYKTAEELVADKAPDTDGVLESIGVQAAPAEDLDAMFDDVLSEVTGKKQAEFAPPPASESGYAYPKEIADLLLSELKAQKQRVLRLTGGDALKLKAAETRLQAMRSVVSEAEDTLIPEALAGNLGALAKIEAAGFADTADAISEVLSPTSAKRTAGQAAVSAAKNTGMALVDAIDGLGKLFGGNKLSSGLTFDDDTYAKAKPLFVSAISHLKAAGIDLREAMRAVVKMVVDKFGAEAAENMKPYVVQFISDVRDGKIDDPAATLKGSDTNEATGNDVRKLDTTGQGALEGVSSDQVQGAGEGRGTGSGAAEGGRGNGGADGSVAGAGSERDGGVGNRTERVPVSGTRAGGSGGRGGRSSGGKGRAVSGGPAAGNEPVTSAGIATDASQPSEALEPGRIDPPQLPDDFIIEEDFALGEGGQRTKYKNNVEAIRLIRDLEATGRTATTDEQKVLAKYVGWGGIPQAFDPDNKDWSAQYAELKSLLDAYDWEAAKESTQYAHYTSREIINGMYAAVRRLGFTGGNVLEAGGGVGNFIGLMPVDLRTNGKVTLVERETIAAAIAKHLYPRQNVRAEDFTEFGKGQDGQYDMQIGNPPFSSTSLTDQSGRKHLTGLSVHNYFIAKGVDMLRDGGIMAVVVSSSFMDAGNVRAREYIAKRAKLLGAIRLPNNAFSKNANTQVTTDIIFLQKLPESDWNSKAAIADGKRWVGVTTVSDPQGKGEVALNQYFADNMGMMLGVWGKFGTMYGPDQPALVARPGQDTAAMMARAVAALPEGVYTPASVSRTKAMEGALLEKLHDNSVGEGGFYVRDGKVWQRVADSVGEAYAAEITPDTVISGTRSIGQPGIDRLAKLAELRRTMRELLAAESEDRKADMDRLRKELNTRYDAYVADNGRINDPTTKRLMRDDPDYPLIAALEMDYEPGIGPAAAKAAGIKPQKSKAKKAAIFDRRVIEARKAVTKADSPQDAINISMAERGRLDAEYIGRLLDVPADEVLGQLASGTNPLLFRDPATDEYVLRDAYLSGNVREKLKQAKAAGLTSNARALEEVQPEDIPASKISVRIGSPWVPVGVYADFAKHLFGDGTKSHLRYVKSNGSFTGAIIPESEALAATKFGISDYHGDALLMALMNNRQIRVTYLDADGKRQTDKEATEQANSKADDIKQAFQDWVFKDSDRAEALVRAYNDANNNYVVRKYDGSWLKFPGKVPDAVIRFRRHQRNAIARTIQDRTTLYDHVVGAGKTFTAIASAMEMRRMGLIRKPLMVVPNHLVGQWASDFYRLYPGAKVLAATKKDFQRENRRRFLAKIASGDWDAVIIAHSSFERIKPNAEFEQQFIQAEIDRIMREAQEVEKSDGDEQDKKRTVKQLAAMQERLENRIAKLREKPMDDLLDFQQLGVDQVFVDEAHLFKNLMFTTKMQNVRGLGDPTGSQRAYDMYIKTNQVMDQNGRGQGVVFMTGTPVSNSLAEMYHMMRYLMPAQMRQLGFESFDAWANTYASVNQVWMQTAGGDGFKAQNRMSNFDNVPELLRLFDQVSDTVTMDDIKAAFKEETGKDFPLPKLLTGRRQPSSLDKTPRQEAYMKEIVDRLKKIEGRKGPPKKGEDNHLTVMSDARKAAMDIRLVDSSVIDRERGARVDRASDEIFARWKKYDAERGTQLVFADLGTPISTVKNEVKEYDAIMARIAAGEDLDTIASAQLGDEAAAAKVSDAEDARAELDAKGNDWLTAIEGAKRGFSVYDDLKKALMDKGIPDSQIAFIHSYNTDDQKAGLFRKVNSGEIRILMGSTAKMGAGTNVQKRLVALHHLDVPWKPSDLEQREGRIIRQGNELADKNPDFEVEILAYVTKDTLDMRMWQIQEVKLKMINQLRTRNVERELENAFEDMEMSAGEMQAAATGNMDMLREIQLRTEVQKLEKKQRAFDAGKSDAIAGIRRATREIERLPAQIAAYERLTEASNAVQQDVADARARFKANINGAEYTNHAEAAKVLRGLVDAVETGEDGKERKAKLDVTMNGEQFTNRQKLAEAFARLTGDNEPFVFDAGDGRVYRIDDAADAVMDTIASSRDSDGEKLLGNMGDYKVSIEYGGEKLNQDEVFEVHASLGGDDLPSAVVRAKPGDDRHAAKEILKAVRNMVRDAGSALSSLKQSLEKAKKNLADLSKIDTTSEWPDSERLTRMREEHKALRDKMNKEAEDRDKDAQPGDSPRMSTQPDSYGPGLTASRAREILVSDPVLSKALPYIDIKNSTDEAPAGAEQLTSWSNNTAEGYYHNGRITLFADNIRPFPPAQLTADERLKWVAFHEITHRGVANLAESDTYLSELRRAAKHPYVKNMAKRVYDHRQTLDPQYRVSMEVATEEALAEINAALRTGNISQIKEQYGLHFPLSIRPRVRSAVSRFFESVKRIFNKMTGRALTDEQLENLLGRTTEAGMGPGPGKRKGGSQYDAAVYSLASKDGGKPTAAALAEARRQLDEQLAIADRMISERGGLFAPNGQPSKLNRHQWAQVRTENFKAWFGDWVKSPAKASKVVDTNGEPLVVYHGTRAMGFNEFKLKSAEAYGLGVYFASDRTMPEEEFGVDGRVIDAFLNIRNPSDGSMPKIKKNSEALKKLRQSRPRFRGDEYDAFEEYGDFRGEAIREVGHDGIIAENDEYGIELVAFSPNQIKSAIGNAGTFSPATNDIRYSTNPSDWLNQQGRIAKRVFSKETAALDLSVWQKTLGTQLNTALKNPAFKKVYDLTQRLIQHVNNDAYDSINAAPDVLSRLEDWKDYRRDIANTGKEIGAALTMRQSKRRKDMTAAAEVLFEGTRFDKKVYSDKELDGFGLTADQKEIYRQARAAIDKSVGNAGKAQAINAAMNAKAVNWQTMERLINADMEPDALFSELRDLIDARIADAKNEIGNGAPPERKAELEKKIATWEQASTAVSEIEGIVEKSVAEGYAPLMRWGRYTVSVVDPATGKTLRFHMLESKREQAALALKLEDKYGKAAVVSGTMNEARFEQFKGITPETMALFASVTGMDQDAAYQEYLKLAIPGRSALKRKIHRKGDNGEGIEGFSTDLPRVLSAFVLSNARKSARDLYRGRVDEAIEAIPDNAGGVKEQATKLGKFVLEPDENDWSIGIRNMLFVWNMGASVAFGVLNLTQPWMMTLPWLSQFSDPAAVAGTMGRAAKLAAKAQTSGKAPKGYEAEYDRAVREGIVDPQNVFMLQGVERGKSGVSSSVWRNVSHGMGLIAAATESMNRKLTLIAALDVARAKGDAWLKSKGFADAYDFAARCVAETQGTYNKGNRPAWARGPVGAVMLVFKQYAINWVEMAHRMAMNHYDDDKYRKGFWMLIGALFMMAGGMGLPFAEDISDLIETGMSWAGKPVNIERQMQMALGKDLYEPLMFGPVNSMLFNPAWADMFGRMSMGNLVPGTAAMNPGLSRAARGDEALEVFGAGMGLASKFKDAYEQAAAGNVGDALITASPRAVTSVAKSMEMAATGKYTDSKGRTVREVSPAEALIKGLDLQPASVARIQRERGRRFEDEAIQTQAKDSIRNALIKAYESGEAEEIRKAEKRLDDWNSDNPLYPVRINRRGLRKTIRERGKEWSARDEAPKGMEWMDEWIPERGEK